MPYAGTLEKKKITKSFAVCFAGLVLVFLISNCKEDGIQKIFLFHFSRVFATIFRAFSNVERLYDEGKLRLKEGDEEYAYQLFSRMGNIAEIIIRKSDFDNFKHTPVSLTSYRSNFLS